MALSRLLNSLFFRLLAAGFLNGGMTVGVQVKALRQSRTLRGQMSLELRKKLHPIISG